jgi:hypothetical protein
LRDAMNEEETFSETARNILSQIGVFKKTDKRPYYVLNEVNTNDEQLKSAYQSICDLVLSEDILSEMPSSDQTDQWKEAKAYLGKLKSEGLFREIDKLKKSLTKKEINPFDSDMSREDFITQLQMLWASLDLNHQNKEEIILESKRLEIWEELNELREAQHLPPYARDAVIGKTPESWSQKIWRQRDWLDRTFKVVEVAGLISQISDFVTKQFTFSKKLRKTCFAQVEAN